MQCWDISSTPFIHGMTSQGMLQKRGGTCAMTMLLSFVSSWLLLWVPLKVKKVYFSYRSRKAVYSGWKYFTFENDTLFIELAQLFWYQLERATENAYLENLKEKLSLGYKIQESYLNFLLHIMFISGVVPLLPSASPLVWLIIHIRRGRLNQDEAHFILTFCFSLWQGRYWDVVRYLQMGRHASTKQE